MIEVKYKGILVGYTYDGKSIKFLNTKEAIEIQNKLTESQNICLSSRKMGTIDENHRVTSDGPFEYSIIIKD